MTRAEDIHNAVATIADRFGSVYALVNNSGGPPAGGFDAFDDAVWQQAFELTLLGFIRSIRAVLPLMRTAGVGRIVNFTSSSTKQAIDNLILSNTFRLGVVGTDQVSGARSGKGEHSGQRGRPRKNGYPATQKSRGHPGRKTGTFSRGVAEEKRRRNPHGALWKPFGNGSSGRVSVFTGQHVHHRSDGAG